MLAGNVDEPQLGLDGATWNRLADAGRPDRPPRRPCQSRAPVQPVVRAQCGGNSRGHSPGPALKAQPLNYVSTSRVAFNGGHVLDEDVDIRAASTVRKIDDTYANGYANSKWAGEVLLREAHDVCGLPARVFRCDMILPTAAIGAN